MKHISTLLILTSLLSAQENLDLKTDFLSTLNEVSEIATKTKLNRDDTPSFVTILHANKLKKLGIDSVLEALGQVPGVQIKREASGVPVVVFRGVLQKGEVKLMVDGVPINNTYRGSIYHYLEFPIELVNRIEVIRGAGSVLYGSGAISGVINIITKSADKNANNQLFVSGATHTNGKGGALISEDLSNFHLGVDSYYQKSKKLFDGVDQHIENYSVGLNLTNENFGLLARINQEELGNAYGILGVADTNLDTRSNKNTSIYTQLSYKKNINEENTVKVLAGYLKYTQKVDTAIPVVPSINAKYAERSYYTQADLISKSLKNNELLVGFKYESAKTLQSDISVGNPISNPNFTRDTLSLYLNDQYALLDALDITAGFRYDDYSDFGDSYSPDLGLVYRATDTINIKAQYTHAFRAPSWVELTSNRSLQAEKSNSLEFGVVVKENQENSARLNVFVTRIDDMITKDSITRKYIQNSKNDFFGTELEINSAINDDLNLNFLASYVDADDNDGKKLADVANILASTSLIYDLNNGFTIGSLLKYVSSSPRGQNDTRGDFPSSIIYDQTITYEYKDFTFNFTVKDLFNDGTSYSLPNSSLGNDFYADGRTFLLKANWEF